MKYKDITVVAIYGNGQIASAVPAMEKTLECLPGAQALLLTDELIPNLPYPQHQLPTKLDYAGYSHFVIYCLHSFIRTNHVLIIQDDGWALNKDAWNDEWLQYDYIGGLTHAALCGDEYRMWYTWLGKENPLVVQNGGFSLRSKAFLEAPSKLGIPMKPQKHEMLNNEDVQLCCLMRPELEAVGLKFAPDEVSKYFSFEHLSPEVHKNVDITKIFGHHSRFRRLKENNVMEWKLNKVETNNIVWENRVFDLFTDYGYKICTP